MKKIFVLVVALFMVVGSYSQIRQSVLTMPDTTTQFGVSVPSGSLVYIKNLNALYEVEAAYTSTSTMGDVISDERCVLYNGSWIIDGNNIENTNTDGVTLNGQVFAPDITASGAKYSGNIVGIGLDDRLFPKSIIDLYNEQQDSLALVPTSRATWARDTTNGYLYQSDLTDKVGIGTNSPAQSLHVLGNTYFYSDTVTGVEPNFFLQDISSLNRNHYGVRNTTRMYNSARIPYRVGGVVGQIETYPGSEYIWNAVGCYGNIEHNGNDTIAEAAAFFGYTVSRGSGTVLHGYGLKINPFENSGGGSWLNGYGVYIGSMDGVPITNKYGIYQVGEATNYFGGNIKLESTTATKGIFYMGNAPFLHTYNNPSVTGGNLFLGIQAGNLTMTGTGSQASYNIGIGYQSLFANTAGYSNTGIGFQSLTANTSGYNNTAIGKLALSANATTFANTAVGSEALKLSTSSNNVAIGFQAAAAQTTGGYVVAVGSQAFLNNVSGACNVGIGQGAGSANTGNNNTFVGFRSGYLGTGSSNVALGYRAGYNETGSYKFYLAADSTTWSAGMLSGSKLLMYGNMSNADKAYHTLNLFAKVAIGSATAPSNALDVTGAVNITTSCTVGTFVKLTPTTEPGSPTEGQCYWDSATHKLRCYDGSTWQNAW